MQLPLSEVCLIIRGHSNVFEMVDEYDNSPDEIVLIFAIKSAKGAAPYFSVKYSLTDSKEIVVRG